MSEMDDDLRKQMNMVIEAVIEMFAERPFFVGTAMRRLAEELRDRRAEDAERREYLRLKAKYGE